MRRVARGLALGLACALALAVAACGGAPARCRELQFSATAASEEREALATIDFPSLRPCAFASGLRVRSVVIDMLPGTPGLPRLSYLVAGPDGSGFTLSHTRAELPFRAIPQGNRHLRVVEGGEVAGGGAAEGFVGPSGADGDLAYLRWRRDGVTTELAATLRGRVTLAEVERVAAALLGGGGEPSE